MDYNASEDYFAAQLFLSSTAPPSAQASTSALAPLHSSSPSTPARGLGMGEPGALAPTVPPPLPRSISLPPPPLKPAYPAPAYPHGRRPLPALPTHTQPARQPLPATPQQQPSVTTTPLSPLQRVSSIAKGRGRQQDHDFERSFGLASPSSPTSEVSTVLPHYWDSRQPQPSTSSQPSEAPNQQDSKFPLDDKSARRHSTLQTGSDRTSGVRADADSDPFRIPEDLEEGQEGESQAVREMRLRREQATAEARRILESDSKHQEAQLDRSRRLRIEAAERVEFSFHSPPPSASFDEMDDLTDEKRSGRTRRPNSQARLSQSIAKLNLDDPSQTRRRDSSTSEGGRRQTPPPPISPPSNKSGPALYPLHDVKNPLLFSSPTPTGHSHTQPQYPAGYVPSFAQSRSAEAPQERSPASIGSSIPESDSDRRRNLYPLDFDTSSKEGGSSRPSSGGPSTPDGSLVPTYLPRLVESPGVEGRIVGDEEEEERRRELYPLSFERLDRKGDPDPFSLHAARRGFDAGVRRGKGDPVRELFDVPEDDADVPSYHGHSQLSQSLLSQQQVLHLPPPPIQQTIESLPSSPDPRSSPLLQVPQHTQSPSHLDQHFQQPSPPPPEQGLSPPLPPPLLGRMRHQSYDPSVELRKDSTFPQPPPPSHEDPYSRHTRFPRVSPTMSSSNSEGATRTMSMSTGVSPGSFYSGGVSFALARDANRFESVSRRPPATKNVSPINEKPDEENQSQSYPPTSSAGSPPTRPTLHERRSSQYWTTSDLAPPASFAPTVPSVTSQEPTHISSVLPGSSISGNGARPLHTSAPPGQGHGHSQSSSFSYLPPGAFVPHQPQVINGQRVAFYGPPPTTVLRQHPHAQNLPYQPVTSGIAVPVRTTSLLPQGLPPPPAPHMGYSSFAQGIPLSTTSPDMINRPMSGNSSAPTMAGSSVHRSSPGAETVAESVMGTTGKKKKFWKLGGGGGKREETLDDLGAGTSIMWGWTSK
ncbi:hypothetical protein T439DRAFT_371696 [Meredithblackwellia eburnea MCA 4105]